MVVPSKSGAGRAVIHIRVKHSPGQSQSQHLLTFSEEGFSIPGSPPAKDIRSLLSCKENSGTFVTPQPPPASKFDFLTTVPTNVPGDYFIGIFGNLVTESNDVVDDDVEW